MTFADAEFRNTFKSLTLQSSESDVEQKIVIPLLNFLGYSDADWQSQAVVSKSKLDFLICPKDSAALHPPYLIIEVKAANKNITHSVWQISRYMSQSRAILGLLTNGYQFHLFYNCNQRPTKIVDINQAKLLENLTLFKQILDKTTCLKVNQALVRSQQQIRSNFFKAISKALNDAGRLERLDQTEADFTTSKTIAQQLPSASKTQASQKSMIITVFNNKGGVGKTTTTINLAAALNQLGKRVLLIDIDAQANLTTGLGIDPLSDIESQGKKDITHLLTDPRTKLEDTIIKRQWQDVELHLVPAHIRLSRMENELNTTIGIDQVLEKKLKKHDYDFVFIDPPPSFGRVNGISLMASSGILIPTQLSAYPIRALEYVLDRVTEIEQLKPLPILGIAVSMYDQKSRSFNSSMTQRLDEVLQKSDGANRVSLFPENTWIPRLNIISVCQDKGYPLYQAEFDNELKSQDKEAAQKVLERYMELAQHLLKLTQPQP